MKVYKSAVFVILIFCMLIAGFIPAIAQSATIEQKINKLLKRMTLDEKIGMLHGNALFSSGGVKRLGIPELTYDDGPLGVREEVLRFDWKSANWTTDSATFLPNGSAIAATWNPALARQYGVVIGAEANARKKIVMLSPAFNICRVPLCGRTYEYYSEDPFLNAQLAVQSVRGIQSQHVAACVKHFAVNNQEVDRDKVNAVVDERALHEIYLPAFKAAIEKGGAYTIMAAYNKVNGNWCSENDELLNQILKKDWKFKGAVISDWGGVHHSVQAAKSGLDVEMGSSGPYNKWYFAKPLYDSVKTGYVSEKIIDDKVKRILWVMFNTSLGAKHSAGEIATLAHSKIAYNIASEAIVLLKNDAGLLPLKTHEIHSIAVIGDNATKTFASGGFGAGVKAKYEITTLAGIQNKLGNKIKITFAQGYQARYLASNTDKQNATADAPDNDLIKQAVTLAKTTDIAIVCIGSNREYESEGHDRKDLHIPFGEQALVDAVTAANPNSIVICTDRAPYDLGQIKRANHTILWSWFNGSEGGNALADVLTGKTNPSGKMPFTFPTNLQDSPAFALNTYPGSNFTATYNEGILVGYRWFDTKKIEPLYPFGYGLSYTNFQYTSLHSDRNLYHVNDSVLISIKIKNTGHLTGKETVQLYISKVKPVMMVAEKELRAFKKINIEPGKSKVVKMKIAIQDLGYYDVKTSKMKIEPGAYKLLACSSSRDIRQLSSFNVSQ